LGVTSDEQIELETLVSQLQERDNYAALEAMAIHLLAERIQTWIGGSVEIRFVDAAA